MSTVLRSVFLMHSLQSLSDNGSGDESSDDSENDIAAEDEKINRLENFKVLGGKVRSFS